MWLSAPTDARASPRTGSSNSGTHESMVQAAHQYFAESSSSAVYNGDHLTPGRRPLSSATARTPRAAPPAPSAADPQPLFPEMSPPAEPLDAHMESFPLVPLPLIPRLSLADLRKCEQGLLQLLQSLSPSSNDEDAQLAKYASRQLSLVQRHIEQARARERVLQLLSGELVPIISTALPVQRPVSAKALPIFLTPPVNLAASSGVQGASHPGHHSSSSSSSSAQLLNNAHSNSRPALLSSPSGSVGASSAKSSLSKAAAKKKRDAIEAARALIKANLSTSNNNNNNNNNNNKSSNNNNSQGVSAFVISAGDHSSSNSNKRRRQLQKKKPTKEEMEKARALQVEKERDRRRQEAYQRLIARQELQAEKKKKKQKSEQQKVTVSGSEPATEEAAPPVSVEVTHDRAAQSERSGDIATSSATDGNRAISNTDAGSESESDESEVSNCSDSDEENEKAIMALEVKVRDSGGGDAEKDVEANGDDDSGDDGENDDDGVSLNGDAVDGDAQEPQRQPVGGDERARPPGISSSQGKDKKPVSVPHGDHPEVEVEDDEDEDVEPVGVDADAIFLNAAEDRESGERGLVQQQEDEARVRQIQEEQIALDLQEFMASRKSAMMEQLQHEKQQWKLNELLQRQDTAADDTVNHMTHSESVDAVRRSWSDAESARDDLDKGPKVTEIAATEPAPERSTDAVVNGFSLQEACNLPSPAHDNSPITRHFEKPPAHASPSSQEPNSKSRQKPGTTTTTSRAGIPRVPAKPCKDYRAYFGNFHCVLTSVFEQRHAFTSNSLSSSSSRDSLVVSHVPVNEQSLRIQLKLYEGWQSIMQDYATVFGNNIAMPRSMLPSSSSSSALSPYTAHYRINSTTRREVCDIVVTALEKLGDWDEHPSGLGLKTTWNLLWTWSKPRVERKTLLAWQKVNHFQHAKALTRKDCLKKNMGKYMAMGGRMKQAYNVVPLTFILPQEYIAFVQAFQEKDARLKLKDSNGSSTSTTKNIWIMKPVALSRGRGISLINDLSQVVYGEQVVIQEYIANPLLLDGYKFDLRLYVLVTSFNPLEAFFYEEGFVRICTRQYENSDLTNLFVHLTNSSIQKENQDAIQSSNNPINAAAGEEAGGTKMTLAYLWKRLEAMGADVEKVKTEIIEVILKSLMCGEDHIPFQVNSFDLYGYDILLDETFRPWLIEINSSPSMARENDLDYQVKDALILDTIKLVDPLRFDRAKFVEVVARRLQDLDNEKKRPHAHIRHPKEAEELAMRQLNEDLTEILRGHVPRNFGDLPEHLGSYRRICPHTTSYNQVGGEKWYIGREPISSVGVWLAY